MSRTLFIIGSLCLIFTLQLSAHGDLSEQIERISKRIEKEPSNASLYLKRGQLLAEHDEFTDAKKDYVQARNLDKDLFVTDLLLARLLAGNDQPNGALIHANAFLKQYPGHPEALISRAGIYQQLGQPRLCHKDLENALTNLKEPNPAHFISISDAVLLADVSNVSEALGWLKKGQEMFGFDIVLKSKEVELYVESMQYENAILAIDDIIEHFPRKEKWFFEKAMIYEKTGNTDLAKMQYEATLSAVENLPKKLQKTAKVIQLKKQSYEKLKQLSE